MKIQSSKVLERVFQNLSEKDVKRINGFVNELDLLIWDPLVQLHCQLAIGAAVEELRALEVGARTLTPDEKERLKDLGDM